METATWPAHCPQCARRYRVKSVDRAHACKQCGSTLVVDAADRIEAAQATSTQESPSAVTAADETEPRARERVERDQLARELKEARTWISPLRGFLIVRAVLYAFMTAVAIRGGSVETFMTAFAIRNDSVAATEPFPVAWNCLLTTAFVVGAIMLRHKPFLSALPLAILQAAEIVMLMLRDVRVGWLYWASTAAVFVGTVQMWRVQRFLRDHPESYGSRAFTGVSSSRGRRASKDEMTALQERAQRRALVWSAAAATLVIGAALASYFALRTKAREPFDEVAQRFESAWRSSEASALGAFWPADAPQTRANFLAALDLRGWSAARPPPRSSKFTAGGGGTRHEMEIPGGTVRSRWSFESGAWRLHEIEMPLPLIQPFAEEFITRWNAGKSAEIATSLAEEQAAALEREVLARNWTADAPKIHDWGERQRDVHKIDVTFESEAGQIVAGCLLTKGGVWQIKSLSLPK